MFSDLSFVAEHSIPPFFETRGGLQCDSKGLEYPQSLMSMSMEDCFITDLEEFLNSTDMPRETPAYDMVKNTPTPSPTNAEVPDFFCNESPMNNRDDFSIGYKDVPSPQISIKEEFPMNSPPSLYHDRCSVSSSQSEEPKQRLKYGHLVSLLMAPPAPMTNTITDKIISQLGHTTDNTRGVPSVPNAIIKKEVEDPGFLDIECEQEQAARMASSDCHVPTDIGSLAMEHVYRDIQSTCTTLNISRDPTKWTINDVKAWLVKTIQELKLPFASMDYFQMDGATLCLLSESDFCQRAPQCGETLYAQLYIWKTASNYCPGRIPLLEQIAPIDNYVQWNSGFRSPGSPDSIGSMENSLLTIKCESPSSNVASCSSTLPRENANTDDDMTSDDGDLSEAVSPKVVPKTGQKTGSSHSHIHLWQFLKELLSQPHLYGSCIRWIDRSKGIFKIEDSVRVARLWGKRKNRPAMNYDKLSRSIRQYYKKGIMKKTERSQRLVYQFCTPYCL